MVGATKHRTAADTARLDAFADIGCLPCMLDGWDGIPPTVQHVTAGFHRLPDEHQQTYPSCPWHHLGEPHELRTIERATRYMGPSRAHAPHAFTERYGPEPKLIRITDVLFEAHQSAKKEQRYLLPAEFGRLARQAARAGG